MKRNNFIHNVWESLAKKHTSSPEVSWGDQCMIDLEIRAIAEEINGGDSVLDVGCANGHATFIQAITSSPDTIHAIDFCKEMIKNAKKHNQHHNVTYSVGDVKSIKFKDNTFDVVYTTRTLINLPTWEEQVQGILECIRVCKPGGKVVLCEAFYEPLVKLNAIRTILGLPPLVEHDFNRYLKKDVLADSLYSRGFQYSFTDISSIYYLGSRVLREIAYDGHEYYGYDCPINHITYNIQENHKLIQGVNQIGVQQKCVINKPGVK